MYKLSSCAMLFATLTLVTVLIPSAALASQLLEDGKQDFAIKRYHAAADEFGQVVKAEPSNSSAYYWLGRSLEELKDREGAKAMYEASFKLDPFGAEGREARESLFNLETKKAALDHPTDGVKVTTDTVRVINQQAGDLRQRKIGYGNTMAQYKMNMGGAQAAQFGYNGPMNISKISDPNGQYNNLGTLRAIKNQVQANYGNPNMAGRWSRHWRWFWRNRWSRHRRWFRRHRWTTAHQHNALQHELPDVWSAARQQLCYDGQQLCPQRCSSSGNQISV
jgi:tetratricopeptide (TPR) repeat protein